MPHPARDIASIDLRRERETPRGWTYDVALTRGDATTAHDITLSWSDHDYWSGGARPPSSVLESVLAWLLAEHPEFQWPPRFDAASIRRRFPSLDESLGRSL
ncbi:MAG: hypothetical protein KDA05_04455 [Phycisphaerales bacterium]|nr:hypothetical protein [Phycisphaerales bacterium]